MYLNESALQSETVNATSIADNMLAPPCWDTPPLVLTLKADVEGACKIRSNLISGVGLVDGTRPSPLASNLRQLDPSATNR